MRKIGVLLMAFSLLVCACTAAKKMNQISLGMTRQEVIELMGEPGSTSAKANVVYLKYKMTGEGLYREDYFVRLIDERVDAFGRVGDFGLGY